MILSPLTVYKNFTKIADGLPVSWLIEELEGQDHLWKEHTFRQEYPGSAHRETESIYLRYLPLDTLSVHAVFNELEARPMQVATELPSAIDLIQLAADSADFKRLGRVMLVKLYAGGIIEAHVDEGPYADFYERFHICISADRGNIFHCGSESVEMRPGELWWFNHKRVHSVENNSDEPRIHLIIDAVAPSCRVEREVS